MEKTKLEVVKERLYIVRWTFIPPNPDKEDEDRVETYGWAERQEALSRYLHLKDQWYTKHLRFQIAQPTDVDVETFLSSF